MKKGSFLLLLTALIWGMAFVAQSTAMDLQLSAFCTCLSCSVSVIAFSA